MKASFLVLVPVFGDRPRVGDGRDRNARRGAVAGILAVLCAVSAPWYVRNLVLAGDPIAPTLNIALYGSDGLWKNDRVERTLERHGDVEVARARS